VTESPAERRVQRRPGIAAAQVHDETVLLDLGNGRYYSLNGTGAAVWDLISQPRTASELCAALQERFDVEPEALRGDVEELLDDLRQHELIELASEIAT
jgi:PqqD family protein of HPr-rel-A system